VRTGEWRVWLPPSWEDIQSVAWGGRYLYYHSTHGGIDNIFALDTLTKQRYRVTASRFGATDVTVSPDGSRILFSDYTSRGYDVGEMETDPSRWVPVEEVPDLSLHLADSLAAQEKGLFGREDIPDTTYPVKRYSKAAHLFKIHSWLPFYFDIDNLHLDEVPVYPGVVLYTQNFLSTMDGSLGYAYMNGEHHLINHLTYRGKYPVVDLSYEVGGRVYIYGRPSNVPMPSYLPVRQELTGKMYVPLNLTTNRFSKGFIPSFEIRYSNNLTWSDETYSYHRDRLFFSYRVYTYSLLKMGHRDVKPRLGYVLDLDYLHSPWDRGDFGQKAYINGNLYLPGAMKHHSVVLNAGYERQRSGKYYYANQLSYPRGYEGWVSERLKIFSAEYEFPLFYPDISLGSFLYVPRFRGQLFFENAKGTNSYDYLHDVRKEERTFYGYGAEVLSDFMVLRIDFPLTLGFWFSYLPQEEEVHTGVHFSVNIYGFSINRRGKRPLLPAGAAGVY